MFSQGEKLVISAILLSLVALAMGLIAFGWRCLRRWKTTGESRARNLGLLALSLLALGGTGTILVLSGVLHGLVLAGLR